MDRFGPAYELDFFSDLEANDSGFCEYPVGRGITFYEDSGTSCSGDYWTATDAPSQLLYVKKRWGWSNDEIRSLVLSNVKDGTKIYLYDNDCGDTDDDYTIVTANRDIGFNELIKIGDLETSWSGGTLTVQHFHNNGLNGKVSLIKIQ